MERGVASTRAPAAARGADASAPSRSSSWRQRLGVALAGWTIGILLRMVYATLRVRYVDASGLLARRAAGGGPVVGAFWHETIPLTPLLVHRVRWPGRVTALLSQHRDAEIAARALAHFGITTVRGSSTRGWLGGLRGLLAARARGEDVVIVPDGPRGPRREAKEGVVQLARATGMPLIAFGAAVWPVRRLHSWDRMQIPLPFARVALVAAPVDVPPRGETLAPGVLQARLETVLARVTAEAEAAVGQPADDSGR
jgi:lysophospholipid acyltransferase (LPLAT)-like uncharacterized protein